MRRCHFALVAFALVYLAVRPAHGDDPSPLTHDKQALAPWQVFVGSWRGVGQPKRGSNQGAWTEQSAWAWHFENGHAELVCQLTGDKYFSRLQLQPGEQAGKFVLLATAASDEKAATQRFTGARTADVLVLVAEKPIDKTPTRISLRETAGGDRLIVLYEERASETTFARLAEVGSTREGSSFAKESLGGPECIVTGGLGTMTVQHNGKKYYVCCTGCRDVFNDDPDKTLAEYYARKSEEK